MGIDYLFITFCLKPGFLGLRDYQDFIVYVQNFSIRACNPGHP